jgi:hypothetical protein
MVRLDNGKRRQQGRWRHIQADEENQKGVLQLILPRGIAGFIPTKVSREFAAVGQHAAGLSGCGCGCGGGCEAGMGQFTATTLPAGTITSAAAGSLMVGGYDASFLENDISLAGYNVPFWLLGIAVLAIGGLAVSGNVGYRR